MTRGLSWAGDDLYVASRQNNNVYKFHASGDPLAATFEATVNSASMASPQGLLVLGETNLYSFGSSGAIYKIDLTAALPTAPVLVANVSGKMIMGAAYVKTNIYFLTYNSSPSSHGQIYRINSDNSTTLVIKDVGLTGTTAGLCVMDIEQVLPILSIQQVGADVIINWTDGGVLQSAPQVNGPYADVPGATAPYTNANTGSQHYFRVKVQ